MKTERRHELQKNQLADWLNKQTQALAPYSRAIVAMVIAVCAAFFFFLWWKGQQLEAQAEGWEKYDIALSLDRPTDLQQVADSFASQPVGIWSRLMLADTELNQGTQLMFDNRAEAKPHLRTAIQYYLTVKNQASDWVLVQRALLGAARAYESLGEKGDLDLARATYQELIDRWPDGPYADEAQRRLTALERTSTKEFFDWFAAQNPTPPTQGLPGIPGMGPSFGESSLPSAPSGTDEESPFRSLFPSDDASSGGDGTESETSPIDAGDPPPADETPINDPPLDEPPIDE